MLTLFELGSSRCSRFQASLGRFRLPQVLDFMSTPCSTKMENLCRASKVLVRRRWNGVLDLSEVGRGTLWLRADDASVFLGLLRQEKWRRARILRFPTCWVSKEKAGNGRPDMLGMETRKIIGSFPQLEELDLLAYEGTSRDSLESHLSLFGRVFGGLKNLKCLRLQSPLEVAGLLPLFFPWLARLHVLHLRVSAWTGGTLRLGGLKVLQSLKELRIIRARADYCTTCYRVDGDQLERLLQSWKDLRCLDMTPCMQWTRDIFPMLAAHPKLETLAMFAGKPEERDALAARIAVLRTSKSLKQLRLVHPRAGARDVRLIRPGYERSQSDT